MRVAECAGRGVASAQFLVGAGESAEFVGGALVCAGGRVIGAVALPTPHSSEDVCPAVDSFVPRPQHSVASFRAAAVRKDAHSDELAVEGVVSDHFYRIRALLYSRFAIV